MTGLLALVAATASGCGADPDVETPSDSDLDPDPDAGATGTAGCSGQAVAAPTPYPDAVPADLPLPPGMIVYEVDDRGATGVVLTGVSPQGKDETQDFFNTSFPAAGFELTEGESEELDAESNWESDDFTGRWTIRDLGTTCPGETLVTVLSRAR